MSLRTLRQLRRSPEWRRLVWAAAGTAVILVLALAARCTQPPRAAGRDGSSDAAAAVASRPDARSDARLVPVPPVPGSQDVPAPDAAPADDAPLVLAPDADPQDSPPELTPDELCDIQFPLHALVTGSISPVFHKPDSGSTRLGYLREGTMVRVGLKVDRGRGCVGGNWYPLADKDVTCTANGFICSTSLKVDVEPPQESDVPHPPDRGAVLPYRYGQNRHGRTYALTRLPTAEELALVRQRREELIAADEAAEAAEAAAAAAAAAGTEDGRTGLVELDAGEPDGEEPPPDPNRKPVLAEEPEFEHLPGTETPDEVEAVVPVAPAPDAATAPDVPDAGAPEVVYSLAGPAPGTPQADADRVGGLVGQWLEKEFFVSIDRSTSAAGERFYRTIRGLYVPVQYVMDVDLPSYEGLVIQPDMPLPIGFVGRGRPSTYRRSGGGRTLAESGRIPRQAYRFLRELDTIGSAEYWITADGDYVRSHNFGVAAEEDPPSGVEPDGKWIQVDLSDQLLVAYEGRRPVFAALVSTGKDGFETPPGHYTLLSKHVSATMDGVTEADGAYSIEDVPWTMFFDNNFAIHGAFWHNRFGMTKSHGCVNMSPIDAKWIFEWSSPRVPEGWHGVIASNITPGSVVIIRE
ncbi:MAG: L,D-transpeptidase [Deltaproteobacteria bacterium]|nr:L,D-transpeptidase [Deltaproteobacteria bacterium]